MSKKVIILTGAAGLVSFAGAFVFAWRSNPVAGGGPETPQRPAPIADKSPPVTDDRQIASLPGTSAPAGSMKKALTEQQLKSLVQEVRQKIQEYEDRLRAIGMRERRLQIAQNVLQEDIEKLDNLRIEVASTVASLKTERDKLIKSRLEIDQKERENLISIAATYDKMDVSGSGRGRFRAKSRGSLAGEEHLRLRQVRPVIEDDKPKVPGYIVTFSDMVTLLLTFFVLLLSLAEVQDPELFNRGRDAFLESIRYVGLGALLGREEMPYLGYLKDRHPVAEPDETPDRRTLDAEAEQLRRLFALVKQTAAVVPVQIGAKRTDFSVVNVHFSPGGAALDESGRRFLAGFCRDLQQDVSSEPVELYVLGLAGDAGSEKEQWMLSAKRAQTVADFMRDVLSSTSGPGIEPGASWRRSKWFIRSWGVGSGGGLCLEKAPAEDHQPAGQGGSRGRDRLSRTAKGRARARGGRPAAPGRKHE